MKKILLIVITLSTTLTLFAQRQMQVWQNGVPTNFAKDRGIDTLYPSTRGENKGVGNEVK